MLQDTKRLEKVTQQETFKTRLQRHNRLAVPTLLRWRYKIEAGELLKVSVKLLDQEGYGEEEFLAKVAVDGRLTVPKLSMQILEEAEGRNLAGAIVEVTITPAGNPSDIERPANINPVETTETKLIGKIKDIRRRLNNKTRK